MSIYTLAFREDQDASLVYGPEERLDIAAELMAAIGGVDTRALVVLPAGYAVATSEARRDEWAEGMATASRTAGVAAVFGIDVAEHEKWGVEGCPRSFAYACDRGRRLFWAVSPLGGGAALIDRTVTFEAARITVVFARELLTRRPLPVVAAARPDLVVVLAHAGPTKKWLEPFAAMDALAPTLVVHQDLEVHRPAKLPPLRGWTTTLSSGAIRIATYRREADGAAARVVGN